MIAQISGVSNDTIEAYIFETLAQKRGIVVDADSELKTHLGMSGVSTRRMMRRLGSMIKRGIVLRCRRESEYRGDDDRPITFKLCPRHAMM